MMKRLTALLLAALMCLGCLAGMAEEECIRVAKCSYVPQDDGTALLHLVLSKTGPALTLDNVDVEFYDASGAVVRGVGVSLCGAATLTLPEGECSIPVTLTVQLPEGVTVAEFSVKGAAAVAAAENDIAYFMEDADGVVLLRGTRGLMMIAFIRAAEGIDPMCYAGYAILYDRDGAYLGNVFLPLGSGVYVAKNGMLDALTRYIPRSSLLDMGMQENNTPASVLFSNIPIAGLPEGALPAVAKVVICALPPQEKQTLSIVDFNLEAADGRFTIHARAQNTSSVPVVITGVPYVALHDTAGDVRLVQDVTLSGPGKAFEPGEVLEFTLTGALEEGFAPVACGFITECAPVR